VNVFIDKGHLFPESTKNGFVSLIAETENAELSIDPSKVRPGANPTTFEFTAATPAL
jgi:hypothetical protein